MRLIYSTGIVLYKIAAIAASPFNKKAKKWLKGRNNLLAKIKNEVEEGYIIWFHAASAGEFEQAIPLIEKIKKENPFKKILVTFFSPSGYEQYKNYKLANYIYYLPIDTRRNAQKFIEAIKPEMVFFIKYDYWFNYIIELYKRQIPFYIVSGILRKNHYFFKFYSKWFRKQLPKIRHFFLQNNESAKLISALGITNFSLTGDTRFDKVYSNSLSPEKFPIIEDFKLNSELILCGSTWKEDEKLIFEFYSNNNNNKKLIIAPHEVTESNIIALEKLFSEFNPVRWSKINNYSPICNKKVIIIDSIGELKNLYQYSDIAYIGGGFGKGIHNILEAACFHKPIIFGTNYKKFKEANDLVELGCAFPVRDINELRNTISFLVKDKETIGAIIKNTASYINSNLGAAEKVYTHCFKV